MRGLLIVVVAALALTACGDDMSPEEQAQADERDVALVEQANRAMPPLELVTPEPLLLPDIERYDLLGETCNYAPGTSLGARVIAREADAFMKIDGEIERFAADPGSRELPAHTRSVYHSKNYSLRLELREDRPEPNEPAQPDAEGEVASETNPQATDGNYEGSVTLRDAHDRIVYEGVGLAQCRS
jgi:hypothetical protein